MAVAGSGRDGGVQAGVPALQTTIGYTPSPSAVSSLKGFQPANAPLRGRRKVAFWGDSRMAAYSAQTATSLDTYAIGIQYWLQGLTGQRIDAGHALNFGVSGENTTEILARWDDVNATDASIVVVMAGTNDTAGYAVSLANLDTMRDLILGSGRQAIFFAEMPRGATTPTTSRLTATRMQAMVAIRQHILNWQGRYPGLHVVDPWSLMADPTSVDGYLKVGVTYDALHPNATGARILAELLVPPINQLFAPVPYLPQSNVDQYLATSVPYGALNTNPMLDGTGGSLTGGATGDVADGYTLTGTTGMTVTGSKITDADGRPGQRIVFTGTPTSTTTILFFQEPTLSKVSTGDTLRADLRFTATSLVGVRGIVNTAYARQGGVDYYVRDGNVTGTNLMPTTDYTIDSMTQGLYVDPERGAPSAVRLQFFIGGLVGTPMSGTIDVFQMALRKVPA